MNEEREERRDLGDEEEKITEFAFFAIDEVLLLTTLLPEYVEEIMFNGVTCGFYCLDCLCKVHITLYREIV